MTKEATPKRARADWEAIERDYRTGAFSDHELAVKHGNVVTRQAISKRAKEKGWTKDLTAAVRQATRAKVIEKEVAERVQQQVAETVAGNVAESFRKTADVVEAVAEVRAVMLRRHQTEWSELASVAAGLRQELREAALSEEDKELLAQILAGDSAEPRDIYKARQTVAKALDLGGRISSIKALSETFTKVQLGQRLAYGLEDGAGPDNPDSPFAALSDNDKARRFLFAMTLAAEQLKG
jgi:hypothetical protein